MELIIAALIAEMQSTELTYTEDDLYCLSAIIYQEAGGDAATDETRMMVGNVVLNRVEHPLFEDTIRDVLETPGQYGMEDGVYWTDRGDNPLEIEARERSIECAQRLLDGERVLPENVIWQAGFAQGDGIYVYQDEIYFCYSGEVN